MPRSTAEERSAAYYRAGKKPAAPPKGMSAAARRIWTEIVESKPVDWFDAGSLVNLRVHCEVAAGATRVSRQLTRVKPGTPEYRQLSAQAKILGSTLATSSRQLRLTVIASVDVEGQKATERGVVQQLLGGRSLKVVE